MRHGVFIAFHRFMHLMIRWIFFIIFVFTRLVSAADSAVLQEASEEDDWTRDLAYVSSSVATSANNQDVLKDHSESVGTLDVLKKQEPASVKKVSGSIGIDSGANAAELRRNSGVNAYWQWIETSVTYRISEQRSVSLSQGFEYAYDKTSRDPGLNVYKPYLPALRYQFHSLGIFGSEDLSPGIKYFIPVSYNAMAAQSRLIGMISADISPTWKVSSQLSASYVLTGKINLVPRDNVWKNELDQSQHVPNGFRILQGPQLSYSWDSSQSLYTSAMIDQLFDYNNSLNFSKEVTYDPEFRELGRPLTNKLYLTLGYAGSVKVKSVNINMGPYMMKTGSLREDYQMQETSGDVESRWLELDNLTYSFYLGMSF